MKQYILYLLLSLFAANTFAQTKKETVAIYPFTSTGGYWDYALEVGNAIEAGVLRSNRFKVVERNRFVSIKQEDRFKEVNTSDVVKQASKLGASTIITGHVVGISQGDLVDSSGRRTGEQYIEISLSFKIIDVTTAQIMKSELIRGKGQGKTKAEALQNAYLVIDQLARAQIGSYLPQTFKFMSVVATDKKKNGEFLKVFKIWGGSKDGLRVNDAVELSYATYLTNPNTGKKVEERTLIGYAKIDEVHGAETATCTLLDHKKIGQQILDLISKNPENLIIEYKGNWHEKKSFWDVLN